MHILSQRSVGIKQYVSFSKIIINPSSAAEHFTLSAHEFENETVKMVGNIPLLRQTNKLNFTH